MVGLGLSLVSLSVSRSAKRPNINKKKLIRNSHVCLGLKNVVVVGGINEDSVLSVERLPQPGETVSGVSWEIFPGGKVSHSLRVLVFWASDMVELAHE